MSNIGTKAERAAIQTRVQFVVDTLNERYGLDIPQSEVTTAMRSTKDLCDFGQRYGQSLDWLVFDDVRSVILRLAHDAGCRQKGQHDGPARRAALVAAGAAHLAQARAVAPARRKGGTAGRAACL